MHELLAPFVAAPIESALIFDVDGTLAPIVARPELARVPPETQRLLGALRDRYGLVACLSGRARSDAERLVGVDGITYVGNHGLDLHPDATDAAAAISRFHDDIAKSWSVENKGLSLTIHYREATDPAAAELALTEVAADAGSRGLRPRWGRKVLEIRPALDADKGTALRSLLASTPVAAALYAGDDDTDRDAFNAVRSLGLAHTLAIAVLSDEAPAGLAEEADLSVGNPAELAALLAELATTCSN